jgi:hypothetical protein
MSLHRKNITAVSIACATIVQLLCAPAMVSAQSLPPVSATLCGSALNAAKIVHALAGRRPTLDTLKPLVPSTVSVEKSGLQAVVRMDSGPGKVIEWTVPTNPICPSYPQGAILLSEASPIPGEYFAVLGAAFQFRNEHPWPTVAPAHVSASDSFVYVERRGVFYYIALYDNLARRRSFDDCLNHEYYRVSPNSLDVQPYNGCIVGGQINPFPPASKLPQ